MIAFRSITLRSGRSVSKFRSLSSLNAVSNDAVDVRVDRFVSQAAPSTPSNNEASFQRLPNDVNERNSIFFDEEKRNMAGVEASVRHVSFRLVD